MYLLKDNDNIKPTSEGFFSLIYKNEYNEAIYEKKFILQYAEMTKNSEKTEVNIKNIGLLRQGLKFFAINIFSSYKLIL